MTSLKIGETTYHVNPLGKRAFILRPKANTTINMPTLGQQILNLNIKGIQNITATHHDLTIFCKTKNQSNILAQLAQVDIENQTKPQTWQLPVFFDDLEDWSRVEAHTKISKEIYVKQLLEQQLSIAMYGFILGFVYINGLPTSLQCPRKPTPKVNLLGSVLALGGPYVGIHSLRSPTGWNVIGKIPLSVLEIGVIPPIAMAVGDFLQIKAIDEKEFLTLTNTKMNIQTYNA